MSYETSHVKVYLGKPINVLDQYEGAESIELQFSYHVNYATVL